MLPADRKLASLAHNQSGSMTPNLDRVLVCLIGITSSCMLRRSHAAACAVLIGGHPNPIQPLHHAATLAHIGRGWRVVDYCVSGGGDAYEEETAWGLCP